MPLAPARRTASLTVLTLTFLAPANPAAGATPSFQERLDALAERLETRRRELHVPGLAIAVVKDGEVVMSRGFGLADLERGIPATDETLFAVGSTTKAFTATLAAMLVDDGVMGWDDPVRRHLPEYRLTDPEADEQVAIRDLLCHRIGFATMTALWYGNDVSREEILETSLRAELLYPFREKWNYSNISYLAAGLAVARAAGSTWEDLLAERILGPLGMTASHTSYEAARSDSRMARGYRWDKDDGKHVHQPMRNVTTVAPAGAINSCARDMARWVLFQLGRGEIDGTRLLSEAGHAETWTGQIEVQGDIEYGLGWFLREWRGRPVVEHAGGIDGFTAEVAVVPEDGLGFALLMNLFASPLQEESREIVFGTLLGEWTDEPVVHESYEPFLGTYVGNFGPFQDAEFEVVVQNDRLAVDVPGQMVFELSPPDEDGRRQFRITDQIAVRFNRQGDEVYSMTIYQAGYAFELPRKGAEMPLEIDLEAARRLTGKYFLEKENADVHVLIRNNRLAVDFPGRPAGELFPPDDEGRWIFRIKETLWVRFNEDDAGEITSLTFSDEGETVEMPRRGGDAAEPLPTAAEVMAMVFEARGAEHLPSLRNIRATGTVRLVHMGARGRVTTFAADDDRLTQEIDLGRFGTITSELAGGRARLEAPSMTIDDLDAEMCEQIRLEHPFVWLRDWLETFEQMQVQSREELDGQPVYAVRLKPPLGPARTLLVSVETGLPVGSRVSTMSPIGQRIPTTFRFDDYREVAGVLMPYRVEMENPISGKMVIELERIEANVPGGDRVSLKPAA